MCNSLFNVHPSKNVSKDLETATQLPVGERTQNQMFSTMVGETTDMVTSTTT